MLTAFRKLFARSNRHSRLAERAGTAAKPKPKLGATFAPLEDRITPVFGAFDIPEQVLGGEFYRGMAKGFYDGVAQISRNTTGGGSAALLTSQRHMLTAEHILDDGGIPGVWFDTVNAKGQPWSVRIAGSVETNAPNGDDIGVLTLGELAPLTLTGYGLYTGTNEVGKIVTHVGYGQTGTGTSGSLPVLVTGGQAELQRFWLNGNPTGGTFTLRFPDSPNSSVTLPHNASAAQLETAIELLPKINDVTVRRVANSPFNPYGNSAFEVVFNDTDYANGNVQQMVATNNLVSGGLAVTTMFQGGTNNLRRTAMNEVSRATASELRSDFDNGTAAANVYGDSLGMGKFEGAGAKGDSGSPVFIGDRIAGVHVRPIGTRGLDGVTNSRDFGEGSIGTRVSSHVAFINGVLDDSFDLVLNMNNQPWGNDWEADDIRFDTAGNQLRIFIDGVLRYTELRSRVRSVTLIGSGDDETISMEALGTSMPVTVNAGGGNDTIRVVGVAAGANFRADGQGGDDLIAVGAGFLDLRANIDGDLSLFGGGGNDRLEFRDQNANDIGAEYTLSGPLFTRSGLIAPVYYAGFDSLGLTTGQQSATVNIGSAAAPLVQITGGAAADQFRVGTGLIGLGSTDFVLNGGGGNDDLRLSDSQSSVARTHRFESNQYTVSGQSGSVTYASFDDVFLFAGKKGDTVEVVSSPDGVDLTLSGNGGNDKFILGNGDLDQIGGLVTVYGGIGSDSVTLNDQNESQWKSFEITKFGVSRTGFDLTMLNVDSMTLNTGNANNNFFIHGTPALTTINAGGGADSFFLSPDDRDLSKLTRGLILNGQGGNGDVVFFNDQSSTSSAAYTLTGSTLTRNGLAGVQFDGMELVRLMLSEEANTVNIQGTKATTQVRIDGNGGNDTFRITNEPKSKVSIFGGTGKDRVIWGPSLLPPNHPNSGFGFLDLDGVEQIVFPLGLGG